jgi:hypothetical protein
VFQLPLLPLRLLRPVYRAGRWIVKYNILGHPYDLDAQIYLAQEALRIPLSQWNHAPQVPRAGRFFLVLCSCRRTVPGGVAGAAG